MVKSVVLVHGAGSGPWIPKLLTHRWLLERVWGPGYAGDVDVLRVFISQLRKKIEADPGRPSIIATEPGIGYRWLLRPAEESDRKRR